MKRENGDLEAFVGDLQKGDEKAFRILFDEFYVALCLFAVRFMEDREAAADIVQEAFLKYWDRHADFDNYYKIKSFLYVVVRHACLNLFRTKQIKLEITEDIAMADQGFRTGVPESGDGRGGVSCVLQGDRAFAASNA